MRATILNCTVKRSPAESNTEALARVVIDALEREAVETQLVRAQNLVAVARALQAQPVPAPPSG